MKFIDAFKLMLEGEKIYLPNFSESKYIHIDKNGYILNDMNYRITVDVNSDDWQVYEE